MRWIFGLAVLAACHVSVPGPDADTHCTKAIYDPCLSEHDCTSGFCHGFTGLLVCSQPCTVGGPACPMQDGAAVECDAASGFCKPAAANTCTFP